MPPFTTNMQLQNKISSKQIFMGLWLDKEVTLKLTPNWMHLVLSPDPNFLPEGSYTHPAVSLVPRLLPGMERGNEPGDNATLQWQGTSYKQNYDYSG